VLEAGAGVGLNVVLEVGAVVGAEMKVLFVKPEIEKGTLMA
jgi:hypothetical protein